MNVAGLRLSAYLGESLTIADRQVGEVIVDVFAGYEATAAALFRGLEGYGAGRRVHTASFPDISTDLPLVATAVAPRARIEAMLDDVDRVMSRGLVTLEHVQLVTDDDVRAARPGGEIGGTAKLTVYCGRGERVGTTPAYRAIVDLLQRQGVPGATVLLGVDGLYHGTRWRARLFARNEDVPMAIVALVGATALARVLPLLGDLVARPLITLERVAVLKHDGEPLEPFPTRDLARPAGDVWQSLEVYTRRWAQFEGRPVYAELTRRLRRAGAAGVTTLPGEWGFTSEETPHGERLWTAASRAPTYTTVIDHCDTVRELWPLVDELTAEHGTVASQFVAAYRERAVTMAHGEAAATVRGQLELAEVPAFPPLEEVTRRCRPPEPGPVPAPAGEAEGSEEARWVRALTSEAIEFARQRGRRQIAVRVRLVDGEEFFLAAAEPAPGDGFVTLYPHPRRHGDLVEGIGGEAFLPRALVVSLASITKLELLPKAPRGTRSLVLFPPEPPR